MLKAKLRNFSLRDIVVSRTIVSLIAEMFLYLNIAIENNDDNVGVEFH